MSRMADLATELRDRSQRPEKYESRLWISSDVEVRAKDDGDGLGTLVGHAAVFNKLSVPMWGFREKVQKGAFKETLAKKDDVRALVDHDASRLLGRSTSGTLRLKEDKVGLAVEIDPPDTTDGRNVVTLIQRGDLSQMSFGFQVLDDHWETKDGEEIRTLERVKLFDVSVVTYPAYEETDIAQRSLDAWRAEQGRELNQRELYRLWLRHEAQHHPDVDVQALPA